MAHFSPPVVVFDLDGTLADTASDLVATLNVILDQEGLPPIPVASARDMIGAGARALIARGFEAAGRPLDPTYLDGLFARFMVHYGANICVETTLFPGVEKALERLEAAGYVLAICTNKMEEHSVKLVAELGIASRFAFNAGRDTFPFFKPDARHLTHTIAKAGGDPQRAVMVGDSNTDIMAARNARIPVIAVPFGYTETPVAHLGPDRVIAHFDHLFDSVTALTRRAAAA